MGDESAHQVADLYATYTIEGAGLGLNVSRWLQADPAHTIDRLLDSVGARQEQLWNDYGLRRTACLISCSPEDAEVERVAHRLAFEPQLRHINFSILVTDAFMSKLVEIDIKRDPATMSVVEAIWKTGLPCISFIDSINMADPLDRRLNCSNPCGEQYLPAGEGCNLGSLNLASFITTTGINERGLKAAVRYMARLLDRVIDVTSYPSAEHRDRAEDVRRIGMGVMGFGSALSRAGIAYGSTESLELLDTALHLIRATARAELGDRPYLTSIAPTGGISLALAVSPGIEPDYTMPNRIPGWKEQVQVLATAQEHVDNAVSKTVLLPTSATHDDVRGAMISAWETRCKGISIFRVDSRLSRDVDKVSGCGKVA
ncbi:MAG: hypothetical protein ABIQ09_18570 [Jatrophihabitantaceae bacterium]